MKGCDEGTGFPKCVTADGFVNVEDGDRKQRNVAHQCWYGKCQLRKKGETDFDFGFFSSFFSGCEDVVPGVEPNDYHACRWAVIDNKRKKYYADSLLDRNAMCQIKGRLEETADEPDISHVDKSLKKLIEKNRLPKPDRVVENIAIHEETPFSLTVDMCSIARTTLDEGYVYKFINKSEGGNEAHLEFKINYTQPYFQGENGIADGMFHYFFPCAAVEGFIKINDTLINVEGVGWFGREFGGVDDQMRIDALDGQTRFSLDVAGYGQILVSDKSGSKSPNSEFDGTLVTSEGKRILTDIRVVLEETWTSLVTFLTYTTAYTIDIPALRMECKIKATFPHQEFNTILAGGYGFYDGCVTGTAVVCGVEHAVHGFVKITPSIPYHNSDELMRIVSRTVTKKLKLMYPLNTDRKWLSANILGAGKTDAGIDPAVVCDSLFKPVRSIIDRGGKTWRSLILVSCCNTLSGQYFDCSQYIAMAELLHVGSLIIDDVEDHSTTRRGGPCCHVEYGLSTAVNAGSACYFMAPYLAKVHELGPLKANAIYELYFEVLRLGHVGQGLDLYGLDYLMEHVVETGETCALVEALRAIHRYKTGSAAGGICRIACVLCDADDEVADAVEAFGSELGLAFQIVDDALNIKGFTGGLKDLAEDVRDGKITYPIALALGKLDRTDREKMWQTLRRRPLSTEQVSAVIGLLQQTSAVDDCLAEARAVVNRAWEAVDSFLQDSISKCMMHAFCEYLAERTN
ncbi:polyprenyl synthase [Angomonas deanei]|nr:polyprenyl synthase [Angomonas deanei]|eukprot:EPY25208.1 polyprenyl synthase [Angomonas deanei]